MLLQMQPTPKKTPALDRLPIFGDSIPAPQAVEQNSDTAWALFNDLSASHDAGFAPTAPASLHMRLQEAASQPALRNAKALTLQDVIEESRRNNRVCPLPEQWQLFYEQLPNRQVKHPPHAMSGAAWRATSSMSKRICLRDQIEWAASQGALQAAYTFLQALPEHLWHHMGD